MNIVVENITYRLTQQFLDFVCLYLFSRSPSEPVNNVTIVEVLNHHQVFNFNQMEQLINQLNQQSPQTSSELHTSRPSTSTSSCTSENSIASPRQSSRHQQNRNASIVEELIFSGRSSSQSESNDRATSVDVVQQRSTSEVSNEGQRVRTTESEDGRFRRRQRRQEVTGVSPAIDQEAASNYEHLVLPTVIQSRPPVLSNYVSTDTIAILPIRPQV